MKKCIALGLAGFLALAAQAQDGMFNFMNAPVPMVLGVYAQLSGKVLVVEPGVTNQTKFITVRTLTPVSRQEATKLMASALQKQANVVFEPLDETRVAVKLAKK